VLSTDIDISRRTIRISKIYAASELDSSLCDIDKMMRLIVLGDDSQLTVAINRFLEVNGYSGDVSEERNVFNEAYNLAFTIKVLLSNIPMQLALGDLVLPLHKDVEIQKKCKDLLVEGFFESDAVQVKAKISKLSSKKDKKVRSEGSSDESSNDSSSESEAPKKRKKRRRGK